MGETITTRVPDEIASDIGYFTKQEHTDKSTFVRKLLATALEEKKIQFALEKYKSREITVGKAAEIAGVPLRKMMQIAADKGIPFQYSLKDLKDDFKEALR